MVASSRNGADKVRGLLGLAAGALLVTTSVGPWGTAAASAAEARSTRRPAGPVELDAASSEVDYKSNTVVFRDVVVTQGNIRVSAERARATGLNFDNAVWTFSGQVRIKVDGGMLNSDEATVDFAENRITRATIVGRPAQFEQPRAGSGEIARGRAGSILYDVARGTVTLNRDAWLTDGRNEISGAQLVYDILQQRVQAQATPERRDERVRITIRPREKDAAAPVPPQAPKP